MERVTPSRLQEKFERLRPEYSASGLVASQFLMWGILLIEPHRRIGFDPVWTAIAIFGFPAAGILLLLARHRTAERRRDEIERLASEHRYEEAAGRIVAWFWTGSWGATLYSNAAICGLLLAWVAERKSAGAWEDVFSILSAARRLPGGRVPNDRLLLEEAEAYDATGRRSDALACLLLLRGSGTPLAIRARAERLIEEIA